MSTINDKLNRLDQYKHDIKDAIIDKGQTVDEDMSTYADAIRNISGGDEPIPEIPETDPLTFIKIDDGAGSISLDIVELNDATMDNTKPFTYNLNNSGWNTYIENTKIPMNKGDKVQFRSSNGTACCSSSLNAYRNFVTDGIYACGGNINSLFGNTTGTLAKRACACLFRASNIVTAPVINNRPGQYAYYAMFRYCKMLIKPPVLTSAYTANYSHSYMFYGCASLKEAPALPATSLGTYCYYNMFGHCTSLTKAPVLPALTVSSYSYQQMFLGCISLEEGPEIYATKLGASAAALSMFEACTKLRVLKCNFMYKSDDSVITDSINTDFMTSVRNNGVFYKNPAWDGPTERGGNTIPSTWTIVDWNQ